MNKLFSLRSINKLYVLRQVASTLRKMKRLFPKDTVVRFCVTELESETFKEYILDAVELNGYDNPPKETSLSMTINKEAFLVLVDDIRVREYLENL